MVVKGPACGTVSWYCHKPLHISSSSCHGDEASLMLRSATFSWGSLSLLKESRLACTGEAFLSVTMLSCGYNQLCHQWKLSRDSCTQLVQQNMLPGQCGLWKATSWCVVLLCACKITCCLRQRLCCVFSYIIMTTAQGHWASTQTLKTC